MATEDRLAYAGFDKGSIQEDTTQRLNDHRGDSHPFDAHGRYTQPTEHQPGVKSQIENKACDQHIPKGLRIPLGIQLALAINAVVPWSIPISMAITIKNIGKVRGKAATISVDIIPTK